VLAPVLKAEEDDEFQPRSSAPPANRTGGASRGGSSDADMPTVSILAPATTVGMTTREQPVIYWYLSADTEHPIIVALTEQNKKDETIELTLDGAKKAGLHKFDFAKLMQDGKPVKLKPGVPYEVVVDVVAKKTGGSENPNATCRIMRLDPKDAPKVAESDPAKQASAYAKEGVWFDYIAALNAALEKSPKDDALLQRRAKALAGQGLMWEPDGKITEKRGGKGAAAK
jgi:hypothetical protein